MGKAVIKMGIRRNLDWEKTLRGSLTNSGLKLTRIEKCSWEGNRRRFLKIHVNIFILANFQFKKQDRSFRFYLLRDPMPFLASLDVALTKQQFIEGALHNILLLNSVRATD